MRIVLILILVSNAFSAWYAKGKGHEKCMDAGNGFLVCRENYVNNFCYGKERMWSNYSKGRVWYHLGEEKEWFNRTLVSVKNLNSKCQYHGWARFKLTDGKWAWQCYINNREAKDEACKGFRKR